MLLILSIIFIFSSLTYYFFGNIQIESSDLFLTISTFIFATFTGFFISRQAKRYSLIREHLSNFDGEMSSMYRDFGHLGKKIQTQAKNIIKKHYEKIIKHKAWDYYFTHKTTTLTDMHNLLELELKKKKLSNLENLALLRITGSLQNLQKLRKNLISIHLEKIPFSQWIIIILTSAVLIITLSIIPSQFLLLNSLLKGTFVTIVLLVVLLLYSLNKLSFFENTIGEHSAKDILDIFSGKK